MLSSFNSNILLVSAGFNLGKALPVKLLVLIFMLDFLMITISLVVAFLLRIDFFCGIVNIKIMFY